MDELTMLRSTRDDTKVPTAEALAAGRSLVLARAHEEAAATHKELVQPRPRSRRSMPRLKWTFAGLAALAAGVLVVGNITISAQSAYASDVLRSAASETIEYADLVPGSGQYLRSRTHARWEMCSFTGGDTQQMECTPNDQILDVYMPDDSNSEWVLYRDWGKMTGVVTGESIETVRAVNGAFYGPESSWVSVDYSAIPTDGAAAYQWVDAQYMGGSASRDEDNFVRITDILRSGLVPAAPRAALLDALSRIPGVTATDNVSNLDGVEGVAIGRNEPVRAGQRLEIIIDATTGLIIGERTLAGASLFGWGPSHETGLTAIETSVVSEAP